MIPLKNAIELVVFAFNNARQGDLFIRKSLSCTMMDLAIALKNISGSNTEIKVIGVRHGEKLHETLVSREELAKSEDMGDYYRVGMDGRDLNYNQYTVEGDMKEAELEDYTSFNAQRISGKKLEEFLLSIPEVCLALNE